MKMIVMQVDYSQSLHGLAALDVTWWSVSPSLAKSSSLLSSSSSSSGGQYKTTIIMMITVVNTSTAKFQKGANLKLPPQTDSQSPWVALKKRPEFTQPNQTTAKGLSQKIKCTIMCNRVQICQFNVQSTMTHICICICFLKKSVLSAATKSKFVKSMFNRLWHDS